MTDESSPFSAQALKKLVAGKTDSLLVQFLRYLVVGGIAFGVDFGAFAVLVEWVHLDPVVANTLSFTLGLITNYAISVVWVFHSRALRDWRAEFVVFAVIGVIGVGLTDLIIWVGSDKLGIHPIACKLFATAVALFWNFGARKVILFRQAVKP